MKSWQAEIVRVSDNHILSNSEHEHYSYQTRYGTELDPGHYLVLRLASEERQYKQGVVFLGPFASNAHAKLVLQSSRYLGLLTSNNREKELPAFVLSERNDSGLPVLLRQRKLSNTASERVSKSPSARAG
jgi:hypothetical protein